MKGLGIRVGSETKLPMLVHIVLFKFNADATTEQIQKVDDDFHQLPTKCKNAAGDNYIKSFESGTNISIENMSQGYTHGYVVKFASKEDRDYYVEKDPAHGAFVQSLSPLETAIVFDFEA